MHRISPRLVLLVMAGVSLGAVLLLCVVLLRDLPNPAQFSDSWLKPSILITDRHGRLLYEAIDPAASKHVPLPFDEIPAACRQATVATEDSRFYAHPGVDPIAIARAALQNWRAGVTVSGGSTLTQQLARNLFLSQEERAEESLRRKLREAWLAWRLERAYSKDEVLALYLNTTYYGHFAVGIEAAAQAYFGMHARELDLAQCALLAGLPQHPAGYNPIENPQAARERQQVVLRLMVAEGYITDVEAADAGKERLRYASTPFPVEAPHFVMWVQSQLEAALPAEVLHSEGLRVITTLDLDWQKAGEDAISYRLAQLRPCLSVADAVPGVNCDAEADPARRVENAALVAMDPSTGAVLAMVGSPDYFDLRISGAVNAALSLRQPGSAVKPLTYGLALDPERAARAGVEPWTAATVIADIRRVFPTAEGTPYVPNNYDRTYHGPVSVRAALANSYNIPAVAALQFVGVQALVTRAAELGIDWSSTAPAYGMPGAEDNGLLPGDAKIGAASGHGLGLALGAGEVRLLDLTAAYAAYANGGRRVTPYAIERVETLSGGSPMADVNAITGAAPDAAVIDARVAYLVTDILSDQLARLPAFGGSTMLDIGRPAAVKTGTTSDWRDNWTLGYTPDLVTGVWVGNADNTPMKDVSGISGAAPIWHDFMVRVLRAAPTHAFAAPEGVVQVEVCADSGLLPGSGQSPEAASAAAAVVPCPHRRLEWFIAGTEPVQIDTSHVSVAIDVRTGRTATASTPGDFLARQVIWALPAEYRAWARDNGIAQVGAVVAGAATPSQPVQQSSSRAALKLVSPDPNRTYRIDPALPLAAQEVPITAEPAEEAAVGQVTLLVDGHPLAVVRGPEFTAWWPLEPGRHTFQAAAQAPDGHVITSEIVAVLVQ